MQLAYPIPDNYPMPILTDHALSLMLPDQQFTYAVFLHGLTAKLGQDIKYMFPDNPQGL
ncbi:hypothetical protein GCM10008018_36040 [Paenibacillus marchantiophytorum]|uniref:Uncharacterized protein n=1 Tax=Paenibacillus marchantiophytorum TaxID=1619310 RepID=A0ABQ1ETK6_9BACL|nr:hypothetical protein GCM10008018_36040 [Paenibacillus marchantiophytorum]